MNNRSVITSRDYDGVWECVTVGIIGGVLGFLAGAVFTLFVLARLW